MSERSRLILIVSVLLITGLAGGWWFYSSSRAPGSGLFSSRTVVPKNDEPTTTQRFIDSTNFSTSSLAEITSEPVAPRTASPTAVSLDLEKKGVESLARVFAEIYGSYSSDNNYQNVLDVRSFTTAVLWESIKPPAAVKPPTAVFNGVTTKVLVSRASVWNPDAATIEVDALRTETKGTVTATFNQKATVRLVKKGENWLVDGFSWAKR